MPRYLKYLSNGRYFQLIIAIVVFSVSIIAGLLIPIGLRLGLMLISGIIFIIAVQYFGVNIIIVILALAWWIPVNLDLAFLGKYVIYLTLPEAIAYAGLLLLPFAKYSRGRQRILLDPVWIFLVLLLLGGLIASGNINTLPGFAMFRKSTFYFISVIIVCRYLLTTQEQIYHTLKVILISNIFFIAFILIAPNFPGIFFEKALSYLDTSRLGGVYFITLKLGSYYFGPNNIGLIAGMGIVILLIFTLFENRLRKRLLAGAALTLNVLVLVLTGSRGSILSTIIAITPIVLYALRMQKKTKVILYVAALTIVVITLLPNLLSTELVDRMQSLTSIINDPYGSSQMRLYLFEKGIDLAWRNPFGIGYGTFVTLTDNFILWEQNLFLNTVLGGGFLGLIGLMGFFFILFGRGISRLTSEPRQNAKYIWLACLGASLAFFFNSLVTDPNISDGVYFAWLVLGITFASISIPRAKSLPSNNRITKAT